jgi:hypothetical protein
MASEHLVGRAVFNQVVVWPSMCSKTVEGPGTWQCRQGGQQHLWARISSQLKKEDIRWVGAVKRWQDQWISLSCTFVCLSLAQSPSTFLRQCSKNPFLSARCCWLTPVILATRETEIRRIKVPSQPGEIFCKTLSWKTHCRKGLVEWLKV